MKFFPVSIFLLFVRPIESSRITASDNKKLCRDCKHFIENNRECSLFGDTNIVTGKKNYERAIDVRRNNNECGENAIYFEKNNYRLITVPYYFLLTIWPAIPWFILSAFYLNKLYEMLSK